MFEDIVKLTIEEQKKNIEINKEFFPLYGKGIVLRDFYTIHIDIGRQTGKTNYIINNASYGDIVFVPNKTFFNIIRNKNESVNIFLDYRMDTINKIYNIKYIYTVYVDEPEIFFRNKNILEFYSIFEFFESYPRFILLGK